MRKGGLEPPRVASHAPQTCASTSSATSARGLTCRLTNNTGAVQVGLRAACALTTLTSSRGWPWSRASPRGSPPARPRALAPSRLRGGRSGRSSTLGGRGARRRGRGRLRGDAALHQRALAAADAEAEQQRHDEEGRGRADGDLGEDGLRPARAEGRAEEIELVKSEPASALPGCKSTETTSTMQARMKESVEKIAEQNFYDLDSELTCRN